MTPNKDKPTVDMFLVRKGSATIERVQVVENAVRWVTVRRGQSHHRERKMSCYHRYHETFAMARHWVLADLTAELKGVEAKYDAIRGNINRIFAMQEINL